MHDYRTSSDVRGIRQGYWPEPIHFRLCIDYSRVVDIALLIIAFIWFPNRCGIQFLLTCAAQHPGLPVMPSSVPVKALTVEVIELISCEEAPPLIKKHVWKLCSFQPRRALLHISLGLRSRVNNSVWNCSGSSAPRSYDDLASLSRVAPLKQERTEFPQRRIPQHNCLLSPLPGSCSASGLLSPHPRCRSLWSARPGESNVYAFSMSGEGGHNPAGSPCNPSRTTPDVIVNNRCAVAESEKYQ